MSTIVSSTYESHIWSAPSAPLKLHSRARETETACCAEFTITKSLKCIEIPQCIYDSCDGLGLLSEDPIGFNAGDENVRRYVNNEFADGTDPTGLQDPRRPSYPLNTPPSVPLEPFDRPWNRLPDDLSPEVRRGLEEEEYRLRLRHQHRIDQESGPVMRAPDESDHQPYFPPDTATIIAGAILAGLDGLNEIGPIVVPGLGGGNPGVGRPPVVGRPTTTNGGGGLPPPGRPNVPSLPPIKPPFLGDPGTTVVGQKQSRRYGNDGKPEVDRDYPHKGGPPLERLDHSHDWRNGDRGDPRPPLPNDPPAPPGVK